MPGKDRVSGDHALLFLGSIRERFQIVTLDGEEYCRAIDEAAAQGATGGLIYDALIAHCALKVRASAIYTWNVKDFRRLGPEISKRIKRPDDN
jgi:predicted nucleic acid-binding protein